MSAKRKFSLDFKRKAVEKANSIGNRPAAALLQLDEKRIREWRKQLPMFENLATSKASSSKRFRLAGGGRTSAHPTMEEDLAQWVIKQRDGYHRVTRKSIAVKAVSLLNNPDFKARRGWVDNFLKRFDFVTRSKTTTGQRLPPELSAKVVKFVRFCEKQRTVHNLQTADIGNMDETAIWADMPGDSTIDVKGVKTVPILTTGYEKSRLTVCLSAMADGYKLQPLVVFKGKRMPVDVKNAEVRGVVVQMSHNGWMQQETTNAWIEKCWGQLAFRQRFLVWDSYRVHLTDESKAKIKGTNTIMGIIPGGCTKLVQPADVSWNAPFKAAYRELYEAWLQGEDRKTNLTKTGKVLAPSRLQMVLWVKEAYNKVTKEVIIKSFETCGISTGDPDKIHCTKVGAVAETARVELLQPVYNPDLDDNENGSDADHDVADQSAGEQSDDEIDVNDLMLLSNLSML